MIPGFDRKIWPRKAKTNPIIFSQFWKEVKITITKPLNTLCC